MDPGAWYLHGKRYSFSRWIELTPIDDEQKVLLKLIYS
jgi:hypothetical protein